MSIGLDLGTTEFRSLRISGDELLARRCRTAYFVLRDTPGHRRLLEHAEIRHATCGDDLVIFGNDAVECGAMLDLPVYPLLSHGRLPNGDPVARQILALMVEAILPPAEQFNSTCCLTVPGGYGFNSDAHSIDVRFLKQLVTLRGYQPLVMSSGMAIVLTELSSASFSGIGISLGASCCEIAVIHCGRELARWAITGSLAELDETSNDLVHSQSNPRTNLKGQQSAWERSCLRILEEILSEAREELVAEGSIRLIPQPARIACAGGITMAPEFSKLFEHAWAQVGWPIQSGQIRFAQDPALAIARGCLIQAIMQGRALPERIAA